VVVWTGGGEAHRPRRAARRVGEERLRTLLLGAVVRVRCAEVPCGGTISG
jgi:hypothetical protein